MRVEVERVAVDAMSTIGMGYGTDVATGDYIVFAGDHRPMWDLAEAVAVAEEPVVAEVEDWQVRSIMVGGRGEAI